MINPDILLKLDNIYYFCRQTNLLWRSFRLGIRVIINIYAQLFMSIKNRSIIITNSTVIVSLTSFPARINHLWITIATLLNQTYEDVHVVLWLAREQFPNETDSLPRSLVRLISKGVDIRFVDDDLRPHKKYSYAFKEWPYNCVITVDDDIIYNPYLVEALVKMHEKFPDCVICNRGINIGENAYVSWKHTDEKQAGVPSHRIMPTGIGGVLYPPGCYDNKHIFNIDVIKQTCLNGDDLWLNFMTRSKGTKVVLTGFKTGLVTLLTSQSSALCNNNVGQNKNDVQIAAINDWANRELGLSFYDKIEINEN